MAEQKFQRSSSDSVTSPVSPGEIIIGSLVEVDAECKPLVNFPGNQFATPLVAMTTVEIDKKYVGRQVALLFANGDPLHPVIMGLIHSPLEAMLESHQDSQADAEVEQQFDSASIPGELLVDGKKLLIEAFEEIELRCGESSIVMTRSGKISIRGKYLLNRAEGVNRILGGSVQVN